MIWSRLASWYRWGASRIAPDVAVAIPPVRAKFGVDRSLRERQLAAAARLVEDHDDYRPIG